MGRKAGIGGKKISQGRTGPLHGEKRFVHGSGDYRKLGPTGTVTRNSIKFNNNGFSTTHTLFRYIEKVSYVSYRLFGTTAIAIDRLETGEQASWEKSWLSLAMRRKFWTRCIPCFG